MHQKTTLNGTWANLNPETFWSYLISVTKAVVYYTKDPSFRTVGRCKYIWGCVMNGCPVLRFSKSNTWSCLLWQPTGNMGAAEKRGFVCRGRGKKSHFSYFKWWHVFMPSNVYQRLTGLHVWKVKPTWEFFKLTFFVIVSSMWLVVVQRSFVWKPAGGQL